MNQRYMTGKEVFENGICSPEELGRFCCNDELTAWTSIDCKSHFSSGSHYKEIRGSGCHSRTVYPFPFCLEDYYELFKEELERKNRECPGNFGDVYPSEMYEAYKEDLSFMVFFVGDLEHVLQKHDAQYAKKRQENDEICRRMMENPENDATAVFPNVKDEGHCPKPEPKPRKRATVTISSAALAVGCSESCIKKWERGESMPNGYPGRGNLVALQMFGAQYKAQKAANMIARSMRRASTGYDIDSYGESYETDT